MPHGEEVNQIQVPLALLQDMSVFVTAGSRDADEMPGA